MRAHRFEPAGDPIGDVRSGFPRVASKENSRSGATRLRMQNDILSERYSYLVKRRVVQGVFTGQTLIPSVPKSCLAMRAEPHMAV